MSSKFPLFLSLQFLKQAKHIFLVVGLQLSLDGSIYFQLLCLLKEILRVFKIGSVKTSINRVVVETIIAKDVVVAEGNDVGLVTFYVLLDFVLGGGCSRFFG